MNRESVFTDPLQTVTERPKSLSSDSKRGNSISASSALASKGQNSIETGSEKTGSVIKQQM
jgi:hypothetical protein